MSHTNSTTNYNLPQFVGTDKPTWLNDVNGAFASIDTQMKANADSATSASTTATTASNAVGTLANLNTTVKTDLVSAINEVNNNVGTVSGVASQASSDATNALAIGNAVRSYLTLTPYNSGNTIQPASSSNVSIETSDIRVVSNSDGTLGKFYGLLKCKFTNASGGNIVWNTPLRPSQDIVIKSLVWCQETGTNNSTLYGYDLQVKTDGRVILETNNLNSRYNINCRFYITPCLLFMQNFGDTPTPE